MLNIFNVFFFLALIAPLFLFSELERWQRIGYILGASVWLVNLLLVGSGYLVALAFLILAVSCAKLIIEIFPIRL